MSGGSNECAHLIRRESELGESRRVLCDVGPGLYAGEREYRSSIGLGVCEAVP